MRTVLASTLAILAVTACSPKPAADYSVAGVEVAQPFSRPAPAGGNGAGFFSLTNRNGGPDTLVAVESPVAGKVELHESSVVGGMMQMRELEGGVRLKAGETVEFKPGGKHIMFLGLKQALKPGDRIPATFVLRRAGRVPVELAVQGGAASAGGGDHQGH